MSLVKLQQEQFDAAYITANEICRELNVTRASIYTAQKRGILPAPIIVPGSKTQLWKRHMVMENLNKWKNAIQIRRGELNES